MHNRIPACFKPLLPLLLFSAITLESLPAHALDATPATEAALPVSISRPLSFLSVPLSRLQSEYQALPNSHADYEERYQAWGAAHPDLSPAQVVLAVNIGLDRDFYSNSDVTQKPDSLDVLVNKYHALPSDYVPEVELLGSRYGYGYLRPEAAAAFRAMADAARADGISLRSVSAYRSYGQQESVYNRYLTWDDQATVDTYSARPGFSEHQTALALDINTASLSAHFENTPAYAWLTEHCAEYGFILRYPQGKESVTGYSFEPWHYRYVGTEIAQACMTRGLTYEEYLALQPVEKEPIINLPIPGLPII